MSGSRNAFELLLRAVASSACPLELDHIRSLATTPHADLLERLDRAIADRRRQLAAREQAQS